MLSDAEAIATASELEEAQRIEWARLRRFVRYARGQQKPPWLPDNTESEYRDIAKKSASNWLDLVVRSLVQGLYVDGYGDELQDTVVWERAWQANGFDARQDALYRAVFTLGYSYNFVLPAEGGEVWMRPEAATNVAAVYGEPGDEWPLRALRVIASDRWELYDDEARYLIVDDQPGKRVVDRLEHGQGQCPVVRMYAAVDLLGLPMGEIEPVIPIQDRIVDATFTLQMVAKIGAFPQRWIAGMTAGEPLRDSDGNTIYDRDGNPAFPTIKSYVDHILMAADESTKFGQFAAADLAQYVTALEAHVRHLAAITQTPPHYLLGDLVNLSADALAAAETGLQRKIAEKQQVLGEGWEQTMRLAASTLGLEDAAEDTSSQVRWRKIESRSLAQTADALLKFSQLGLPVQLLLRMIPDLSQRDIEEAEVLIAQGGAMDELLRQLSSAQTPVPIELG